MVRPDESGHYELTLPLRARFGAGGMYDYRRMTPEQKRAIVEVRRAQRFPLHKPPHLKLGPGWYLISAATYEHQHHFSEAAELTALQRRLFEACEKAAAPCAGWVVMPNHYHLLVQLQELPVLGTALGAVHGRSGRYANQRDRTAGRRVWYKYSDRKVRSERHFWTCLHYIMINPVKHVFAEEPFDWPWSCIHELRRQHSETWIEDVRRDYPLREFGKEWDD